MNTNLSINVKSYNHPEIGEIWVTCLGNYVLSVIEKNGPIDYLSDGVYLWVSNHVTRIEEDNFINYVL